MVSTPRALKYWQRDYHLSEVCSLLQVSGAHVSGKYKVSLFVFSQKLGAVYQGFSLGGFTCYGVIMLLGIFSPQKYW